MFDWKLCHLDRLLPGNDFQIASKKGQPGQFPLSNGDELRYNPHIHLLVSEGAWVESKSKPGTEDFELMCSHHLIIGHRPSLLEELLEERPPRIAAQLQDEFS